MVLRRRAGLGGAVPMTDATFQALAADVRKAEADGGPKLKAYRDTMGVWTIGYGTNLQELEIDEATAERFLLEKLAVCEAEAMAFPWFQQLSDGRQRAIVELIYSLGVPRLLGFVKFLRAMAAGDYAVARAELLDSRWRSQVGDRRAMRIADQILHG